MTRELVFNGQRIRFDLDINGGDKIKLTSGEHEFSVQELAPGSLILQNSRGRYRARVTRQKDRIYVWLDGRTYEFQIPSGDDAAAQGSAKSSDVRAPMPGTLIKLFVKEGDAVAEDQVVAVLEAMKMEHQLRAPFTGKVQRVAGAIGEVIDADAVIVALEPAA